MPSVSPEYYQHLSRVEKYDLHSALDEWIERRNEEQTAVTDKPQHLENKEGF